VTVSDISGAFRAAFLTAATTAINDPTVLVCLGHPGTQLPDDIVSIGDLTVTQDFATMSTNRTREMVITQEVIVSIYRAGGPDQEPVVSARGFDLLNRIEEYVRVTDTTLGGLVRWCMCTGHGPSGGSLDTDVLAKGRVIEVPAQFTARARITN
jgi:hypothetical protein